ncbi:hypothetical protein PRUPE_1G277800 [Prunus persica]|uniref:Uncharacterized protein n=1 Tax=Prunus persica TaxID=3760 RepID=A0A251R581_PRUPE|nr:hypothetical protein PRUPE_1G277800 [Prunus persica]
MYMPVKQYHFTHSRTNIIKRYTVQIISHHYFICWLSFTNCTQHVTPIGLTAICPYLVHLFFGYPVIEVLMFHE